MRRWLLSFLMVVACNAYAATTITDDRGKAVTFERPPQRIVTLLPSLTETVCELGACTALVGVDNFSNWPASIQALPRVGGLEDANIEQIVALRPDVVLVSATARALTRLEGLGVRVLGLELKTMADFRRTLGKVGQMLGKAAEAERAWAQIDAGITAAARELPPALRGVPVYFEIGSGFAASESSHIGEVLARVGAGNIVPGSLGTVPKLNPEFVVRAEPKLIMAFDGSARTLAERPGWSRLRAVREGRICAFTPAQGDVIVRPGPRLAESARLMVRCLREKGGG
jgi:iron complex transport system substrate-binding protein